MKSSPLFAFSIALLSAVSVAFAAPLDLHDGDQVKLGWAANHGTTGAGAFTATGVGVSGDSFLTFCLERTEYVSLNTPYYVQIDTAARNGGYGGQTSPGVDPISAGTAWLYTQFRNGSLDDGGFSGFQYGTSATHDALQLAFWKLEGELNSTWLNTYLNNPLAQSLVQGASTSNWNSIGDVRVMNLYSGYSNGVFSGAKQSQLYLAPVPEPETYAMLMAGLGLMGVVARRRKQGS